MAVSSIFNDASIRYVGNITWSKVSELNDIPNFFAKEGITQFNIPAENRRNLKDDKIINLSNRLKDLQDDLDRYNPSLIQRIINFFTGRLFTLCRLSRALPDLIKVVSAVASKVIRDQKKTADAKKKEDDQLKADADAGKKAADAARRDSEKDRIRKEKEAERAAKAAKLADDARKAAAAAAQLVKPNLPNISPTKVNAANNLATTTFEVAIKAMLDDAQDEDAIKNGDEIRVNISDLPITPDELAQKTSLIGRAKKYIDNCAASFTAPDVPSDPTSPYTPKIQSDTPAYSKKAVEKVKKYVRTLLLNLALGRNVPLPRWYHATGTRANVGSDYDAIKAIVNSQYLHQLGAPRGYGTYFSSVDEHEHQPSYGEHTFLFDEGTFTNRHLNKDGSKKLAIHYFPGDPIYTTKSADKKNRNTAIWIRVRCIDKNTEDNLLPYNSYTPGWTRQNCIPVNSSTVAVMATNIANVDKLRSTIEDINISLKAQSKPLFNISVLDREEVDLIRHVFDAVESHKSKQPTNPSTHEIAADIQEQAKGVQAARLKYREKGQLVVTNGRFVPTTWLAHERNENYSLGFPYHMHYLTYKASGKNLEPSFGTPYTNEELLDLCKS